MSIRIEKRLIAFESFTQTVIEPEYLSIKPEELEKYMQENPMPEDPAYSKQDLIFDLTVAKGFYCMPEDSQDDTIEYVEDLLTAFILG